MSGRPILIIHPNDNTTFFLEKIKKNIVKIFKEDVHHFNVHPNDISHEMCLERIQKHSENGIIIFLGHGRTDKLYGAVGKKYGVFASYELMIENPSDYYFKEAFIDNTNIAVFSNKKVFCLACNSNELGKLAIEKGAKSFLGFGDIPSSYEEFLKDHKAYNISLKLVYKMRYELNHIIKTGLEYAIINSYSFEQLHNLLQFIINQRIATILIEEKNLKYRYILTDVLYTLKKEMVLLGDKNLMLLS